MAFVAHRDGVSRIDLRSRIVSLVSAPDGVALDRLERIRWNGSALIAVQVDGDGSRRIIRLEMNARGTSITRATTLEVQAPTAGQTFVTLSGDELVYLNASSDEFVAYRVPLP
jgi:hypothetical protein